MKIKNSLFRSWKLFIKPRVCVYIIGGTLIIFLTFLTNNNAMEIAISGIASVFIGIGVNNFTAVETHAMDERRYANRLRHTQEVLEITKGRLSRINAGFTHNVSPDLKDEIRDLERFIDLSIRLIHDRKDS